MKKQILTIVLKLGITEAAEKRLTFEQAHDIAAKEKQD